jgi:hypothetical protein
MGIGGLRLFYWQEITSGLPQSTSGAPVQLPVVHSVGDRLGSQTW